jgi:hypothetical protein
MSTEHDRALARTDANALVYPAQSAVAATLASIEAFQVLVRASLHDPRDFTMLPGTSRHTLLKPGAEKIVKLISCADTYEVIDEITDWDRPLFAYTVKCRLVSMRDQSVVWSEGLGECNTHEPKYRYRQAQRSCPVCGTEAILKSKQEPGWFCWRKRGGCGETFNANDPAITGQELGRVENPDPAELRNTMLKMAKKRSLVDAALSVASLSDLFTQDLDDRVAAGADTDDDEPERPRARAPQAGARIDGPDRAYDENGQVETRSPHQAAAGAKDLKGIKNGGDFMEYVNARWPGHNQQDILGCLNVQKISDLTWTGKNVSGYIATLIGFWGTGEFDEDGVIQEPEAQPPEEDDPAAGAPEDAEEEAAQKAS